MMLYREISWWYWALTSVLLITGLAGRFEAFYLATALSVVQVVHFRLRHGSFGAFPVQVRLAYTVMLMLALWAPMNWLFWLPAVGTPAQVLFGYCTLARCLSLLPWNRREPLSGGLLRRTFLSAPVRGSVMQGLPETFERSQHAHNPGENIMNTPLNEVVVHINETVDDATLDALEQDIRRDQGVISVGRRPNQNHLMVVVYDSAAARASGILHAFRERGLHAQLIGM